MTKNQSVYSNTRTLQQPEFIVPYGMSLDQPQTMNGLMLLSRLLSNSVPLVLFDPQYRSVLDKLSYGNEGSRQRKRSLLPQMDQRTITAFHEEIERILMPMGHLMLWADKYTLVQGGFLRTIGTLRAVDLITWNKGRIGMGYRTRRCSEYLMIFQKPPVRAKGIWQIHDIPDDWSERTDKSHPHAKPIGLMERLIRAVTNEGDVVVDPAAGGYSVLRAAHNADRRFFGCDIVPV
jgi:site-specific DNA-methyltransferase (adenine-specific)